MAGDNEDTLALKIQYDTLIEEHEKIQDELEKTQEEEEKINEMAEEDSKKSPKPRTRTHVSTTAKDTDDVEAGLDNAITPISEIRSQRAYGMTIASDHNAKPSVIWN
ncbi:MAG: hypothetical protein Q9200_002248 [Gallowayella weberi]